jgi:hypothetical protein
MSYNGSGTFNINTAGQPVVTGTVISSTAFNALTADLGTGLSTAITKNGQTTVTANIPFNGYKLTGIAVATASGDALSYGQAATVSALTDSALTSGRVPYASTAGLFVDSANLTFNGTTLTAAGFSGPISGVVTSTSITDSGLTSGRVTYATTGGLLTDSANLTFNGTTLTANTIGAFTLSGTVAGGGNQLNNVVIGTTTPLAGAFTTLTTSSTVTHNGGTANGVTYLNGSKVLTSGSALTWDTTNFNIVPNAAGSYTNTINLSGSSSNGTKGHIGQFADSLYLTSNYYYSSGQNVDTATYGSAGLLLTSGTTTTSYIGFGITAAGGSGLSEQMRLTSTGLGIGTSSPAGALDVIGRAYIKPPSNSYALSLGYSSTSDFYYIGTSANTTPDLIFTNSAVVERMRLTDSGNLLVGTTSGSDRLTVNGTSASFSSPSGSCTVGIAGQNASGANAVLNLTCPGSNSGSITYIRNTSLIQVQNGGSGGVTLASGGIAWIAVSDERKKENLVPIANAITKVSSLRSVTGNYIADVDKKSRAFLIAQDVEAVLPEAVDKSDPDVMGLAYTDVIPLLVAAIKEQTVLINSLKARLDAANL